MAYGHSVTKYRLKGLYKKRTCQFTKTYSFWFCEFHSDFDVFFLMGGGIKGNGKMVESTFSDWSTLPPSTMNVFLHGY